MQVDFFLKHNNISVHLDLQVVPSGFDFGLELMHFLLLLIQESFSLILSVLLSQSFDSLSFLDLEALELLSVVHCLLDPLVNSDQLFVLLHFLELGLGFYLHGLDGAVKFLVE